jgi:hypothetical protein
MENEFVTYEQSVALMELGMDTPYFGIYGKEGKQLYKVNGDKL